MFTPADFAADEAGLFEDPEVFRDGVERDVERLGNLRDGAPALAETG